MEYWIELYFKVAIIGGGIALGIAFLFLIYNLIKYVVKKGK